MYVDTGAMYRTVGLYALRKGVTPRTVMPCRPCWTDGHRLSYEDGAQHIYLNGENVTAAVRAEAVSMAASGVSAYLPVRAYLLGLQRGMAETNDVVMDGRDMGTAILPGAQVKIFLTASSAERAQRRWKELCEKGETVSYAAVLADVEKRDWDDSHRAVRPLNPAAGCCCWWTPPACPLDEAYAALAQAVRKKLARLRRKGAGILFYCIIVPLAWLVWHIAFRIRVIGREHLIKGRGFVLAPNHISAIDPVFVVLARFWGRRMIVMGKKSCSR
ncbi:MAG: (d)CMP kinase [Ruthenibacterium lactatiformans]